ncbi:hypothetical protein SH467x_004096 [Pirellulaceae bacterium SH467]|jgi:hypothetical protein
MIKTVLPRSLSLLCLATVLTWTALALSSFATEPPRDAMWGTATLRYEVLSRPSSHHDEAKPRTEAPQTIRPVKPYAYGWFGPTTNRHWYRQFGHQSSYTQYSLR